MLMCSQFSEQQKETITTPQPFYGPFSGTTRVSGARRELLDFMVQERLGVTPSGPTSAYLHHPPIFFTGRMPFLPPNQQHQSTEGN